MFFKLLHKIRQKPEATRQLITLVASIAVTAIIAGSWAISFIPQAGSILGNAKAEDILGPFSKISEKIPAAPSMNSNLIDSQTAAVGVVGAGASSTLDSTSTSTSSTVVTENIFQASTSRR